MWPINLDAAPPPAQADLERARAPGRQVPDALVAKAVGESGKASLDASGKHRPASVDAHGNAKAASAGAALDQPKSEHAGSAGTASGSAHAEAKPAATPTGKVYALKDGSGYVALASDGNYYRVDGGSGHGLLYSSADSFVSTSMVNLTRGPVSSMGGIVKRVDPVSPAAQALAGKPAERAGESTVVELSLPGSHRSEATVDGQPVPAQLEGSGQANASSREVHTLIGQKPDHAIRSQANISAQQTLSLLR